MAYQYTTWDSSLETGYSNIDKQHKEWIAAVNAIFDAHQSKKGRKEVEQALRFLLEYTSAHFSDEEAIQEAYEYPGYLSHKQLHEKFKEKVLEMGEKLHRNDSTGELVSNVCLTMGRWVVHHIKVEDCKMAAYIRIKAQELMIARQKMD